MQPRRSNPGLFLTSKVRLHCDQGCTGLRHLRGQVLFLTSKVRLHCDAAATHPQARRRGWLFLTSKVRLHCDEPPNAFFTTRHNAFPDLKGQAPLRLNQDVACRDVRLNLFLTSKVRLHCDSAALVSALYVRSGLFLTSKVRLHCDLLPPAVTVGRLQPFPDLKGQAPLRLEQVDHGQNGRDGFS